MQLHEAEFDIPVDLDAPDVFRRLGSNPVLAAADGNIPIRFVVTEWMPAARSIGRRSHCEVGFLSKLPTGSYSHPESIFRFRRRLYENQQELNAVLLVPTGIGAEIGGHAGDAAPAARTLAAVCDRLIVHPNVVNASDINEMTANMLYVEGSVISRLLMGTVGLAPVRGNRIATVIQHHDEAIIVHNAINAVNAAKAAGGFRCTEILALPKQMRMQARYTGAGRASGTISRFDLLCDLVAARRASFDALAITSVIDVDRDLHDRYFDAPGGTGSEGWGDDIVNPWGGVEALLTHALSSVFDIPSAHAPMYEDAELMNSDAGVMDPAKAAEGISVAFLHCLFKGLSASPRVVTDPAAFGRRGVLAAEDLSCLILPSGCLGLPVLAALHQGIPVIEIKDAKNGMRNELWRLPWSDGQFLQAENYFEATGMVAAMRAGVAREALQRPLGFVAGSDMVREKGQEKGPLSRHRPG
jgi:hypothetical protein